MLVTYGALVAALAVLMELGWTIRSAAGNNRFGLALHIVLSTYFLVCWLGLVPALVLRRLGIKNPVVYLAMGVISAEWAYYAIIFAAEFQILWAFCCIDHPPLWTLLWRIASDGPLLFQSMIVTVGYMLLLYIAATGLFWGLVTWLLMRPRQATAMRP
jgi:hypothetical protein